MRKTIGSSLFAFLLVFAVSVGTARAVEWGGTQVLTTVAAERPLTVDGTYGLRGHLFHLEVPSKSFSLTFAYVGPAFLLKTDGGSVLWISPQLTAIFNFFEGRDALGPSLWVAASKGKFSLFLEGDVYFGSESRKAYYGFYAVDFRPITWLNLGVHTEQTNKLVTAGPHVGMDQGPVHFEIQYHQGEEKAAIRLVTTLKF